MIQLPLWVLLALVLLVLAVVAGMWASGIATRLNRLHIRTDSARISLEGALAARAAVIGAVQPELAGMSSQVSRVPLRATDMGARSDVENGMLRRLTAETLAHPAFVDASTRVDLAARFYNDAVADTRTVRSRAVVHALHLAGSAPLPEFYEALSAGEQP
ncbi:hypothetical protein [Corynebacterium heidelbergense]|uniref:NUDIX hydrolase n=1 Tax=Corynebacterium heidelbergense TaxID=2055947 RepID=A0A364V7U3_9CORY|nr:hypothetical protein [Corynebacterium heidelbergense]RAV32715.1 hypothetical protein DLJ54_02070 [Corynebacterium heidelbergense]RAV34593.1 hypothetical protein CWC39_02385 [Corynebacterium heidelbergense]WCZ36637.1 hypothetical protein CHEID_05475 [Corynebacterium heidelbergense]